MPRKAAKPTKPTKKNNTEKVATEKVRPQICRHLPEGEKCSICTSSVNGNKKPEPVPYAVLKSLWFCTDCDNVVLETSSGATCLCEFDDESFKEDVEDYPDSWIEVDVKVYERE